MSERTVFIIGTPYCGSTLLGASLNAHPAIFFAGEIERLDLFAKAPERSAFHEKGCRICASKEAYECPVWPADFIDSLRRLNEVAAYRAILARSDAPIMIDGSKRIDWSNRLYDTGLTSRVSVIVCARNPFAFANSEIGSGRSVLTAATIWRDHYENVIRSLACRNIPSVMVRYEDFAFRPEPTIRRLCDFLNIAFNPQTLAYWNVPCHAIGGNSGAYLRDAGFCPASLDQTEVWKINYFANKPFGGWVEDKWINDLSDDAIYQIMGVPGLSDTASMLGYSLAWFAAERQRIRAERQAKAS
jgi:hypothetical protein